ncbi:MAG: DUF3520 domain-containing protein [Candidatus Omnitrophica bacterium]|nr:DUF3520 domain-containing protein [Candidatus Omnitrophota bacterium]
MKFTCLGMKKLISAYIDGEVSFNQREALRGHLKSCKNCNDYYQQLKKMSDILPSYKDEEISLDLEQKIKQDFLGDKYKGVMAMRKKIFISAGSVALVMMLVFVMVGSQTFIKKGFQGKMLGSTQRIVDNGVLDSENKKSNLKGYSAVVDEKEPVAGAFSLGSAKRPKVSMAASGKNWKDFTALKKDSIVFKGSTNRSDSRHIVPHGGKVTGNLSAENYVPYETSIVDFGASFSDAGMRFQSLTNLSVAEDGLGYQEQSNTEGYDRIYENDFLEALENPLSTFSIDVDTASYANTRRYIMDQRRLPPKDAVRIEEMINYFDYQYPQPTGDDPFSIISEVGICPWNSDHKLALVGLQGKEVPMEDVPSNNLVFLIDVSGSMNNAQKLPLLKQAFKLLVKQLRQEDRVSIVVYAGAAGMVLDSTPGNEKESISRAIDNLSAGGSTAGGAGIKLAYKIAEENFLKDGNNRVILATDGDFNVGASSNAEMVRLIEANRDKGIFLTALGFGAGNYKDSKMEGIADKGNGNYAYIDNLLEAKKVFVKQLTGTLLTIAKDVKIQIEFNPSKVKAYRLIGYENRMLKKEDFNDDKKDAGELGAGHRVTALYEIVPAASKEEFGKVDALTYQQTTVAKSDDLMTVKLRYKKPDEDVSKLITNKVSASQEWEISNNYNFASSVAEFGMLLRNSEHKANASYGQVLIRAKTAKGADENGYRAEFIRIVETAELLVK